MATVGTRGQRDQERAGQDTDAACRALGLSTGWTAFSYLIAGMLAYGGIGWLVGRATHISLLFPIGMIVGLAISVGYVIYRYGRAGQVSKTERGDDG